MSALDRWLARRALRGSLRAILRVHRRTDDWHLRKWCVGEMIHLLFHLRCLD